MSNTSGSIVAKLGLDSSDFKADLNKVASSSQSMLGNMASGASGAFKKLSSGISEALHSAAGSIAAGFGIERIGEKLIEFGAEAMKSAHEIQDWSERLGVSAKFLQQFQGAAKVVGVESEQANKALAFFQNRVAEGDKIFKELDVNLEDAQGNMKSLPDILMESSAALSTVADDSTRAEMATELFGNRAGELINIVGKGPQELKRYMDAVHTVSDGSIKAMADADIAVQKGMIAMKAGTTEAMGTVFGLLEKGVDLWNHLGGTGRAVIKTLFPFFGSPFEGDNWDGESATVTDVLSPGAKPLSKVKTDAQLKAERAAQRADDKGAKLLEKANEKVAEEQRKTEMEDQPLTTQLADATMRRDLLAQAVKDQSKSDEDRAKAADEYVKTCEEIYRITKEINREDDKADREEATAEKKKAAEEKKRLAEEAREKKKLLKEEEKGEKGDHTRHSLLGEGPDANTAIAEFQRYMQQSGHGLDDDVIRSRARALRGLSEDGSMFGDGTGETLKDILEQAKSTATNVSKLVN